MRYLILLLIPLTCNAGDWTDEQKYLTAGYLVISYVDYRQTLVIAENGDEANPYLGHSPSSDEVKDYFIKLAAINMGIAAILPTKWRTRYLYALDGFSFGYVLHNHWIGYRVDF